MTPTSRSSSTRTGTATVTESWGYLQFSTGKPGTVALRPDPAGPVRHLLHQIYYAQHEHRKKHNAWAPTLGHLGLAKLSHASMMGGPVLQTTSSLFEAQATV